MVYLFANNVRPDIPKTFTFPGNSFHNSITANASSGAVIVDKSSNMLRIFLIDCSYADYGTTNLVYANAAGDYSIIGNADGSGIMIVDDGIAGYW